MKMLATDHVAYYQLKWATQQKIPLEGYYTKRVEDNLFNNELHPGTRKEYER